MKSSIPIPVPQRVSPGDTITSSWANQVRDCIQRLTNRQQPNSPFQPVLKRLPFEVTSGDSLQAAPGIFCDTEFNATIESAPLDGDWFFQGLLVIDDTTGSVVSATVEWNQTEGVNTETDFYTTIATVYVDNTTPSPPYIVQYNYGTIVGIIHGSIDQVWNVTFF